MDIRISYGISRKTNTDICIRDINRCLREFPGESCLILVPEPFSALYEDKLSEESIEKGLFHLQVMTFRRLSHFLFQRDLKTRENYLDQAGKSMLIYEIIRSLDQLAVFEKSSRFPLFSGEVAGIIRELKRYGILPDTLENLSRVAPDTLARKFSELSCIYRKFEETMVQRGFLDADDDLRHAARIMEESDLFWDARVWFDGFDGFTPQEESVVKILAKRSRMTTFSLCCRDPNTENKTDVHYQIARTIRDIRNMFPDAIRETRVEGGENLSKDLQHLRDRVFLGGQDPYQGAEKNITLFHGYDSCEEAERCAAEIHRLVQREGMRYRDISVVISSYEDYRHYLENQLRKYSIPYFMDEKRPLLKHPLISYLIAVLDIYQGKYDYDSVFSYLKSPYSDLDPGEVHRLENYVLRWGIKGVHMWTVPWAFLEDDQPEQKEMLDRLNALREKVIANLSEFFDQIRGGCGPDVFLTALFQFLVKQRIHEKLKKMAEETRDEAYRQELSQSWNILMKVLDDLYAVVKGNRTAQEFKDLLFIGLSQHEIGVIPPALDLVTVGPMNRTRTQETRVLFLLGANEPFPAESITGEGILSDNDRTFMEEKKIRTAHDTKTQALFSQLQIFNVLTIPSERIWIGWSTVGKDGKPKTTADVVGRIKALFPLWSEGKQEQLEMRYERLYHPPQFIEQNRLSANLGADTVRILYRDPLQVSVSRLERFAGCPFSFFAEYGLRLKEREIFGLKPVHMGQILHRLVQELSQDIMDFESLTREECLERGKTLIERMRRDIPVLDRSKRMEFLGNRLLERAAYSMQVAAAQIRAGNFQPSCFEMPLPIWEIRMEDGSCITLRGRIDRMDVTRDGKYFRVIDYKSSSSRLRLYQVEQGVSLQLPIYLYTLTKTGSAKPAGMYYFLLDRPLLSQEGVNSRGIEEQRRKELRLEGYTLDNPEVLEASDRELGDKVIRSQCVMDEKSMLDMFQHLEKTVMNLCARILRGDIRISPIYDGKPACEYCPYRSVCSFDDRKSNCQYRHIRKTDEKNVLWGREEIKQL